MQRLHAPQKKAKKDTNPAVESSTLDVSPPLAELAASGNLPAIETNAATSKQALRSATQPNPETSRSLSSDPSQCTLTSPSL